MPYYNIIMIKNISSLEIFDSFIDLFGENEFCKAVNAVCVSFEQKPFCGNNIYNSPFERCFTYLACSDDVCQYLNFTKEEMYAMIAHEIGHIYYKTTEMDSPILIKEKMADSMAIQLGLKRELSSALQKMIDSGDYEDVAEDMRQRIHFLSLS